MLVLALDTTTRAGSVALCRDGALLEVFAGDPSRTHATRLPGDLLGILRRHGHELPDVDLFAVAAGPGSFTGLRIGIATIQGLAFALQRPVAAISALEALAHSSPAVSGTHLVGAWMDAQRGEVYAELYDVHPGGDRHVALVQPAMVGTAVAVLDRWHPLVASPRGSGLLLLGDGALAHRSVIEARMPDAFILDGVPPLAPTIAALAARRAEAGLAGPPHAIKPVYVRRPDAELARDRKRREGQGTRPDSSDAGAPRTRTHG